MILHEAILVAPCLTRGQAVLLTGRRKRKAKARIKSGPTMASEAILRCVQTKGPPHRSGAALKPWSERYDQNVRLIETAQVRGRPGLAVITPSAAFTSSTVL